MYVWGCWGEAEGAPLTGPAVCWVADGFSHDDRMVHLGLTAQTHPVEHIVQHMLLEWRVERSSVV